MENNKDLSRQEKAEACLLAIAKICAASKSITFETDWEEFGAATIIMDGSHTHIGGGCWDKDDEDCAFSSFVDSLYGQLTFGSGLSWVKEEL